MNVDRKKLLAFLYRHGAFWNPAYPNGFNVDQSSVLKLTEKHAITKNAIASWQGIDANFSEFANLIHGRNVVPDGDVGPATIAMLEVKRCAMPDFPPPPNASFHYDDPRLQKAVESMQAAAMGTGSWPSCDPQRIGVNSFRVRLNPQYMPTAVQQYHVKALQAVVTAYAEMGCAVRYILDATSECEIEKRFESLSGSVIGWNEFPYPDTCNQTISGRLDTGYAPTDYRYWVNLEGHETGHGVGLQHTNGSIMNPSILLVWPFTWKGSPSETSMRRYFGGVGIPTGPNDPPPNDPPTDPPPKPPAKIVVSGTGAAGRWASVSGTFKIDCDKSTLTVALRKYGTTLKLEERKVGEADELPPKGRAKIAPKARPARRSTKR